MVFVILMDLTSGYSSPGKGQQCKKEYKYLSSTGLKIYLERQTTWNHKTEMYFQAQGDSSAGKMLAWQVWGPEFKSPENQLP